jgi:hypothetical protein
MMPLEWIALYHSGLSFAEIDRLAFTRWRLRGSDLPAGRRLIEDHVIGDDILDWPGFHPAVHRARREGRGNAHPV